MFDLDGTLCDTVGRDYADARPRLDRIARVNALYAEGHTILIDTARGSGTGEDWQDFTECQLDCWGVKRHRTRTGLKLAGDVYVDDKAALADTFFV